MHRSPEPKHADHALRMRAELPVAAGIKAPGGTVGGDRR
jgi:hypothetical protein